MTQSMLCNSVDRKTFESIRSGRRWDQAEMREFGNVAKWRHRLEKDDRCASRENRIFCLCCFFLREEEKDDRTNSFLSAQGTSGAM